jgi:hypothetical protein
VAYSWLKTIPTAIERKLALPVELKNKLKVVDDPRKEVNTEVTKTVGKFFIATELAKCGLSNIFKGKFLAPVLLAALSATPNKPDRVSLPAPHATDKDWVRLTCHHAIPEGTNWSGDYSDCKNKGELLKKGHMDIPVWIATNDLVWAEQQARALNFWSTVLDADWYPADKPEDCALAFVDGNPSFMDTETIGIAQMPTWNGFQGLIAVNLSESSARTPEQKFRNAVHELGHLSGLEHNPIGASVMYPYDVGTYKVLMKADLAALEKRHALRPGVLQREMIVVSGHVPESDLAALRVDTSPSKAGFRGERR